MTEYFALRPKTYTYSYLTDDCEEDKKAKGTKKCIIKRMFKFYDYKYCLLNNAITLKPKERFKSETHDVYTKKVSKIALGSNNDKRLQTFDGNTTYPYETSAGKVCNTKLSSKVNTKRLILTIILIKKYVKQSY